MESGIDRQTRVLGKTTASLWTDTAWPVLAGGVIGVGLIGLAGACGWLPLVGIYIGTAIFLAVLVYGTCADSGVGPSRAIRFGFAASLVLVVLVGLELVFPVAGWALAAVVVVTSPYVAGRLGRLRPVRLAQAERPRPSHGPDQEAVDAMFAEIVSDLTEGSGPEGT